MIIGVTGVFGSGKTNAAKIFAKYGYIHINADEIGHKLLNKEIIRKKIINEFGREILTKGRIDRNKLKKIVFYKYRELQKLNKIIHPYILTEISRKTKLYKNAAVDAALIIEANGLGLVDKLIVLKLSKKEQLKRIKSKKKYNSIEIRNIIKSQLSQKEKLKYADIVVDSSGSLKETRNKLELIIESLKNEVSE